MKSEVITFVVGFFIFIRCLFHCEGQRTENKVHVASQKSIQLGIPARKQLLTGIT